MTPIRSILMGLWCVITVAATAKPACIDPTGTYTVTGRTFRFNGRRYHAYGELRVSLLDSTRIAVSFYTNNGGPSYNSGAFVDTLIYRNNEAVHVDADLSSCTITIAFSKTVAVITEHADDPASACGFGYGVTADGVFHRPRRSGRRS